MMLRGLIKTAAAEALCRTGADNLLRPRPARDAEVLVLGYHQVVEDCARRGASIPSMVVSVRTLERQLDWVGRRFRFVSLDELGEHLQSGARAKRPLAAVTFDDGYRDVYENAFPLLKRKGIPAAVFVVTELVSTSRLHAHDRLYMALARLLGQAGGGAELGRRIAGTGLRRPGLEAVVAKDTADAYLALRALIEALTSSEIEIVRQALAGTAGPAGEDFPELQSLTWGMLAEMSRAGVTIGSHTHRHPVLTHESRDRAREELRASRQRLESTLGRPVWHFAYPDGRFNAAVVDEVAAAGYRFAYTTCRHRDPRRPLLTVPRRLLWENSCVDAAGRFSPAIMRCHVQGLFDVLSRCRQDHRQAELVTAQPRPA